MVMGGDHPDIFLDSPYNVIIFLDSGRGHRMQLHPGPAARSGDVLQTQARPVPRPGLPLRAGPSGQVRHIMKTIVKHRFNLMMTSSGSSLNSC